MTQRCLGGRQFLGPLSQPTLPGTFLLALTTYPVDTLHFGDYDYLEPSATDSRIYVLLRIGLAHVEVENAN
jgi:hypothetical protein